MIAASNGSECAKPQDVGSGGILLDYTGQITPTALGQLTSITAAATVVPYASPAIAGFGSLPGRNNFNLELRINAKADNVGNQLYKGKITYSKKVLGFIPVQVNLTNKTKNAANASTLAYDYFPGGNYDNAADPEEFPLPLPGSTFWADRSVSFTHQPYCHVPVPSALDIGQGNVALIKDDYFTPYRGASPPTGSKSSPFTDGFITAFNGGPDNEPHVQINRRNGDWMAGWLQNNNPVAVNCSFACTSVSINGPSAFCGSSGNYSIAGLPSGAAVTWSASPAGIVNIACSTCVPTTLSRITDGIVTLQASFSGGCGALPTLTMNNITVGTPKFTYGGTDAFNLYSEQFNYSVNGPGNSFSVCPSEQLTFTPYLPAGYVPPGVVAHQWTITGTYASVGLLNQESLAVTASATHPSAFSFTYRYQNACGWSPLYYGNAATRNCAGGEDPFIIGGGGFDFSLSPNPASSSSNIVISGVAEGFEVRLFDAATSGLVKTLRGLKGQKQLRLPLAGLKPGFYVVQITSGGVTKTKQLSIGR